MSAKFYPIDVANLLSEVCDNMDGELDHLDEVLGKELWSILEQVDALGPGHYDDPAIRQLYNWLTDPQRTVQEFNWIVGPLGLFQDFDNAPEHLEFSESLYCYLGLVAAEAMAAKSPILQGAWENAAWLLCRVNDRLNNCPGKYGIPSDHLCDWIIHMMGDSNFCPNPYLRLEFMDKYRCIVYDVNTHNKTGAFDSTIFICSTLNMVDYSFEDQSITYIDFMESITMLLERFEEDGYLMTFDKILSDKLLTQISGIIDDFSCSFQFKPNRNTGSYEMSAVAGLFQSTSAYAKQALKNFQHCSFSYNMCKVPCALQVLLRSFKMSCKTPQLIDITAACIMDLLELVFHINIALIIDMRKVIHVSLGFTDNLLKELIDHTTGSNILTGLSVAASPVIQTLNLKNSERLSNLRQKIRQLSDKQLQKLDLDCYVVLTCSLFNDK